MCPRPWLGSRHSRSGTKGTGGRPGVSTTLLRSEVDPEFTSMRGGQAAPRRPTAHGVDGGAGRQESCVTVDRAREFLSGPSVQVAQEQRDDPATWPRSASVICSASNETARYWRPDHRMKSTWSMVTIVVVGPVAPACGAVQAAGPVVVVGCAELTVPVAGDAPHPAATRIPGLAAHPSSSARATLRWSTGRVCRVPGKDESGGKRRADLVCAARSTARPAGECPRQDSNLRPRD